MTQLSDMNRKDVFWWLQYHGWEIRDIRAETEAFIRAQAERLAKCNGVFERNGTNPQNFAEAMMDSFDKMLAQEVREDLGL